jgi:hypothetical protein
MLTNRGGVLTPKEISPFEPAEFWQSPVFTSVAAGFPSPADDYLEKAVRAFRRER